MKLTKELLLKRYGKKCMICGKNYPLKYLEWHHIKPRYLFKRNGKPPDDSIENSAILCANCHTMIHKYMWEDDEYQNLTKIILQNKASF